MNYWEVYVKKGIGTHGRTVDRRKRTSMSPSPANTHGVAVGYSDAAPYGAFVDD